MITLINMKLIEKGNNMEFNYDGFPKQKWIELYTKLRENDIDDDEYCGSIRVGDLCFDIILHTSIYWDSNELDPTDSYVCGDLYIGGVDSGYGYGNDNYPYDYSSDGADMSVKEFLNLITYEEWKTKFEELAMETIERNNEHYGTVAKANEPLHVW